MILGILEMAGWRAGGVSAEVRGRATTRVAPTGEKQPGWEHCLNCDSCDLGIYLILGILEMAERRPGGVSTGVRGGQPQGLPPQGEAAWMGTLWCRGAGRGSGL